MAYRWERLERLLAAGSDPIKAAEIRGAIQFLDFFMSGGLDETARNLLDLPPFVPAPVPDYQAQTNWTDLYGNEEEHP